MNLDNIFNAFEDDAPLQEKAALVMLQETQAFKLGMFKKIIWKQKDMDAKLEALKKHMPELVEFMAINNDEVGELVTYARAWVYIKDFNPTLEQGIDAARIFSDEYTVAACDLSINFWEEREEYEKCAHIKKVKDLLKKSLPS
jgi:hypothetical protein